jgi:FkbM family methyltransferase
MSNHVSLFPLMARALHKQSPWCAVKMLTARLLGINVKLRSRYADTPVRLRAGSHDFEVFHSIHNANEYPQVADSDVCLVIDAGAHAGIGSLRLAHMFPQAEVVSVEPNQDNFTALRANTAPVSRIRPINAAIWYRSAKLAIRDPQAKDWAFQVAEAAGAELDALTLNELVPTNAAGKVFVKLDIEGAEAEVMPKNSEWLRRIDYLLIEVHDCYAEVFKALKGLKYTCRISGEYLFIQFKRDNLAKGA